MPSSTRGRVKQHIDVIIEGTQRYKETLVDLANLYMKEHPEYANAFMEMAAYLDRFKAPAEQMRDTI